VASWPTTSNLGLTDGTRELLQDLLRLAEQLTEDPEQTVTGRLLPRARLQGDALLGVTLELEPT
jgi:hypothetical protein